MTPLGEALARRIAAEGPIGVADLMAECLWNPAHGAYAAADPLGASGHFVTAPEVSQMFGELLGLALAQAWLDQGRPRGVLAELGPGRGTLMADALRATAAVPGFHDALALHLVEASAPLRAAAGRRLPGATWHESAATLPEAPLFLVANEFLDALPVRQWVRSGDVWAERVVGLRDEALAWGLAPPVPVPALAHRLADTKDGDVVETAPGLPAVAAEVGRRVALGGAALVVDYGDWRSQGDTLQALSRHRRADPLEAPGQADLTAHVDFEALALAAAPARHTRLSTQGAFLERLGIEARAARLGQQAERARLTSPAGMGTLFKVMGLYPPGGPVPPGLVA